MAVSVTTARAEQLTRSAEPFVLLDDARRDGAVAARLYRRPVEIVRADTLAEIDALLARLGEAQTDGLHVAGFLNYEAGHAFEACLAPLAAATSSRPLGWFGVFEGVERIASDDVPALLGDPAGASIAAPVPRITEADYIARVETILEHIRAGDIYQANLTFACDVAIEGDPLAAYARLRQRARAGYGGIVHTGDDWLLSLSPELFFALDGEAVTARPMKGTATRGTDEAADRLQRETLVGDPKQRAENLMIVDLMRNDLSRVSRPGSVKVPHLFRVETYPTVHQLVSTITARLVEGKDALDIIRAAFPCGSITGAPKIRAMEIIAETETAPRGAYTGSIGFIAPDGEAAFNVAIRTLHIGGHDQPAPDDAKRLHRFRKTATLGLGAGIVADSDPQAEWRECLAKGAFVSESGAGFDLVETMAFDPLEGLLRLDRHLARMKASAAAFGFDFDRHRARNELQAATFRLRHASKLRLLASPGGALAIEIRDMPRLPNVPVPVGVVERSVSRDDVRLRHKTTDRAFYDEARAATPGWEAILVDEAGFVTEGSFTNVFVDRGGSLLTPPLELGLLPGILREELIDQRRAIESPLRIADLAGGFYLGNSLRGLIPARLIEEPVFGQGPHDG